MLARMGALEQPSRATLDLFQSSYVSERNEQCRRRGTGKSKKKIAQ